jgi:hypothetical protein
VLASIQSQPVSSGNNIGMGNWNPILYIGTDGHLNAEWWNGTADPITSPGPVDDGQWHHAVLTATTSDGTTTQALYLDGTKISTTLSGSLELAGFSSNALNLTFGAGYTGGQWPDEPYYGNGGTLDLFTGQLAAITLTR